MSGIRLAELEASEMLDVLHYFFEDDYAYVNQEEYNFKQAFRKQIYKNLYDVDYAYQEDESPESNLESSELIEDVEPEELVNPFNPRAKRETKSFIDPTLPIEGAVKPFGDILDMPLG